MKNKPDKNSARKVTFTCLWPPSAVCFIWSMQTRDIPPLGIFEGVDIMKWFTFTRKSAVGKVAKTRKDNGFSLTELMVVVVVMGVLAAIAVPVYTNVQNSAENSATLADLTQAKVAVVAYAGDKAGVLPGDATVELLADYGFTKSNSTSTIAFAGPKVNSSPTVTIAFCLKAVSFGGKSYYVTHATTVAAADSAPPGCTGS